MVERTLIGAAVACLTLGLIGEAQQPPATQTRPPATRTQSRDVFFSKCGLCHPPERVTATRRTRAQWEESIDQMITARGAVVSPEDHELALDYLVRAFGPLAPRTAAAAQAPAARPARARARPMGGWPAPDRTTSTSSTRPRRARGRKTYATACIQCHGTQARGGRRGSNLVRSLVVLRDRYGSTRAVPAQGPSGAERRQRRATPRRRSRTCRTSCTSASTTRCAARRSSRCRTCSPATRGRRGVLQRRGRLPRVPFADRRPRRHRHALRSADAAAALPLSAAAARGAGGAAPAGGKAGDGDGDAAVGRERVRARSSTSTTSTSRCATPRATTAPGSARRPDRREARSVRRAHRAARQVHRQEHARHRRLPGVTEMKRAILRAARVLIAGGIVRSPRSRRTRRARINRRRAAAGGRREGHAHRLVADLQRRLLRAPLQPADEDQRQERQRR